jgi:hypothetical protein
MVKRLLYASAAFVAVSYAAPAAATTCGGFTVPTDIANQPGWTCNTVTPTWDTTNSFHNVAVDPLTTPEPQDGLPNIPAPSYFHRVFTTTTVPETSGNGVTCTSFGKTEGAGGDTSCDEAKFRTHGDFTMYGPFDPIRGFCDPTGSHLHMFFGSAAVNSCSTYKSLRKRAISSAAIGTDVNGTAYWFPPPVVKNRDGDGKDYVIKLDYAIIYYAATDTTPALDAEVQKNVPLKPGKRYVFGFEMDDGGKPTDPDKGAGAWYKAAVDAANAANAAAGGSATRYQLGRGLPGTADWATQAGYNCAGATAVASSQGANGTISSKYLTLPDGSDPYAGTCEYAIFSGTATGTTLTVTAVQAGGVMQNGESLAQISELGLYSITGQTSGTTGGPGNYTLSRAVSGTQTFTNSLAAHDFFINIVGPECWDGKNLWSPGGYKNLVGVIYDSKYGEGVCPNNFYHVPGLKLELHFTSYGWADRQRWVLSSDASARARLGCSTSVCPNGFTFHTDWFHAWDMVQMTKWLENCLGVYHHTPHQCAVSQISATEALYGAAQPGPGGTSCGAGGRCPQVDTSSQPHFLNTDKGWGKIPSSWLSSIGPHHVHP